MKVKLGLWLLMGLGAWLGVSQTPAVRAERMMSQEHQIVVKGVVPELRMIVVDEQQRIKLITSNTPSNVAPRVMLLAVGGPEVPLTDGVRRQYENLLERVPGDKSVTITPAPEPLSELLPDFAGPVVAPAAYEVMPSRGEGNAPPRPFWLSAR